MKREGFLKLQRFPWNTKDPRLVGTGQRGHPRKVDTMQRNFATNGGKKGQELGPRPATAPASRDIPGQEGQVWSCGDPECPGGSWEPWLPGSPVLGWAPAGRNPVCSDSAKQSSNLGQGGRVLGYRSRGVKSHMSAAEAARVEAEQEGEWGRGRHSKSLLRPRRVWSPGQPGND